MAIFNFIISLTYLILVFKNKIRKFHLKSHLYNHYLIAPYYTWGPEGIKYLGAVQIIDQMQAYSYYKR